MRKVRTVVAVAMAVALAVPAVIAPDSSAAVKAPKLSMKNGDSIITGNTKTFKIKNVKKSNVKSLKVKVWNTEVANLKSKTKTAFTLEAVGGGLSEINVTVKLKKAQAGKKVYKFENTVCCGSDEAPQVKLRDSVTNGELTALVLKAGSKADEANPDNELVADLVNMDAIGARNVMVHWFEDGTERDDWFGDGAETHPHRPAAEDVVIVEPATGSAANLPATPSAAGVSTNPTDGVPGLPSPMLLGLVQQSVYQVLAVNSLSGKASISRSKIVRFVPEKFIEIAIKKFQEFVKKYPDNKAKEILANDQKEMEYLFDFKDCSHAIGICIGMTDGVIDDIAVRIHEKDANVTEINKMFLDRTEKMSKVGKYLGIDENLVKEFFRHLGYIANKSLTDNNFSLRILDFM